MAAVGRRIFLDALSQCDTQQQRRLVGLLLGVCERAPTLVRQQPQLVRTMGEQRGGIIIGRERSTGG